MGCKGVQHFTRRELLANLDRSIDWHMCGSCCVVPKAAHLLEASWHGLEKRCVAHSLAAALCLEPQAFRREDIGNWDQTRSHKADQKEVHNIEGNTVPTIVVGPTSLSKKRTAYRPSPRGRTTTTGVTIKITHNNNGFEYFSSQSGKCAWK